MLKASTEKSPRFCKDSFVKKWTFRFGNTKAAVLRCETVAFAV